MVLPAINMSLLNTEPFIVKNIQKVFDGKNILIICVRQFNYFEVKVP